MEEKMPRKHGTSQKVVEQNTKELIKTGRKPDQAYAIAKSWQREDSSKSKKKGKK